MMNGVFLLGNAFASTRQRAVVLLVLLDHEVNLKMYQENIRQGRGTTSVKSPRNDESAHKRKHSTQHSYYGFYGRWAHELCDTINMYLRVYTYHAYPVSVFSFKLWTKICVFVLGKNSSVCL